MDPKSQLQILCQKSNASLPVYKIYTHEGGVFRAQVEALGKTAKSEVMSRKKLAEINAAERLLSTISQINLTENTINYKEKLTLPEGASHAIKEKFNYIIKDENIFTKAFTTSSYQKGESNDKLALIGDSVIYLAIRTLFLYNNMKVGEITQRTSLLVSNSNLTNIIGRLNICKYAYILDLWSTHMMATLFEAIIGAIYIDSDYNMSIINEIIRDKIM